MQNRKRVCLVGINNSNFGDPIILKTTEWLLHKSGCQAEFVPLDLKWAETNRSLLNVINCKWTAVFNSEKWNGIRNKWLYKDQYSYFLRELKGCDVVVVVGGGIIKYKYELILGISFAALCQAANKLNVAVVVNAVGVEGYDKRNDLCQKIKSSLELPCVKRVTTRDDVATLTNCYLINTPEKNGGLVADPAVWAAEAYGVKQKEDANLIGLNIGRGNLFRDNGINFSSAKLLELYTDIFFELRKRNYMVCLYTNGGDFDYAMAVNVKRKVEELSKEEVSIYHPQSPIKLVQLISSFKTVVCTRLHSSIISYSLRIPFVGLVWNDKQVLFGNNIGHPELFIRHGDFESKKIVDTLEMSMNLNLNFTEYRQTILDEISLIKRNIINA